LAAGTSIVRPLVPLTWNVVEYGWHTITVHVDTMDTEFNETSETDNIASRQIFAYRHPKTWWYNSTLAPAIEVNLNWSGNLEIRGNMTIRNARLTIDQNYSMMHVVKIMDNGRLTLDNAIITGGAYPLVIYVTDNGRLEVGSQVLLDTSTEEGLIYTDGNSVLVLRNAIVDASIRATGRYVTIEDSDLQGSSIYIDTTEGSTIWDTTFTNVVDLDLLSDDSNPTTPDFDLGNITLNQILTDQLRFKGDQYIKFTNVTTFITPGKDWYDGMVGDNARIERCWWLTVRNVDGIGNPIAAVPPGVSHITIERYIFDDVSQQYVWVTEFSQNVPSGVKPWPAVSEVRYSIPDPHSTEHTYHLEGYVTVSGTTYYPDSQQNVTVTENLLVDLKYSVLTPDLIVESVSFGGPGQPTSKPSGKTLYLNATLRNDGMVAATNVLVYYFTMSLIDYGNFGSDGYVSPAEVQAVINLGQWYRVESVSNVPASGSFTVSTTYYQSESSVQEPTISVYADPFNSLAESDETNNEAENTFTEIFHWPDYWAKDLIPVPDSVAVDTSVQIRGLIKNSGQGPGSGAIVYFYDGGTSIGQVNLADLAGGAETYATLTRTFTAPGQHNLSIQVVSGTGLKETDYNILNNNYSKQLTVFTKADLTITGMSLPPGTQVLVNTTFMLEVTASNLGQASAYDFNISVYHSSVSLSNLICEYSGLTLPDPTTLLPSSTVQVGCSGIPFAGTVTLHATVDPTNVVFETDETNNNDTFDVTVGQVSGYIDLVSPRQDTELTAGSSILVEGWVNGTNRPIEGISVTVFLADSSGTRLDSNVYTTNSAGQFLVEINLPSDIASGSYQICASTGFASIPDDCVNVSVSGAEEGFPWWLILLIIIIVIIIIVATVVYLRYRGLGKMVECGECGALIPEGSSKCPKCGVEYETDTVKCSSCGAWIPADVKNCPDCGVEFVVGEVKAEDYQARMRKQYDQLVNKFREQAKRDLGAGFSEDQFQGWWRAQPTYISFEQWLREEEEKKKMGSAPCPTCGTLNSVTAKICHRCGTPLKKVEKPPAAPPARPPAGPPGPPPAAAPPAESAAPPPTTPVPKKVVKKPVVPKRVVIRRPGEPPEE
jgi:ribosomal protein L40E